MQEMYPAMSGSPQTALVGLISATAVVIAVEDAAALPPGPNLATLGDADRCEVVRYAAIENGALTGCVRGFGGSQAQIWPAQTPVCRAFTAHDHDAFAANIAALAAGKIDAAGDASQAVVQYTPGGEMRSGASLGGLFGAVAAWREALGAAAYKGVGTGAADVAAGDHAHADYAALDADGKLAPGATSARTVSVAASRALLASDAGRCLDTAGSSPVVLTIPADVTLALPTDTEIEISQEGSGLARIEAATGVTLSGIKGTKGSFDIAGRYGVAILKKKGANSWRIAGDVV